MRATVPRRVEIDLGVVDILITRDGGGGAIEFTGHGEKTDVGSNIDSPTTGMDLGDLGDYIDEGKPKRKRGKRKRKPQRRTRRDDDLSGILEVKGEV